MNAMSVVIHRTGATKGYGDCPIRGVSGMNVSDVIHGRVTPIDLHHTGDESFPRDLVPKSELFLHDDEGGELRLDIGGDIREVEGAAPRDRDALRRIGIRRLPPTGLAGAGHRTCRETR